MEREGEKEREKEKDREGKRERKREKRKERKRKRDKETRDEGKKIEIRVYFPSPLTQQIITEARTTGGFSLFLGLLFLGGKKLNICPYSDLRQTKS